MFSLSEKIKSYRTSARLLCMFLSAALFILFSIKSYGYDFSIGMRTIGGDLKITNWSTYSLNLVSQKKNKMEKWNFPSTLSPSSTNIIRVEFGNENSSWWDVSEWWRFQDKQDISGVVIYQVDCGDNQREQVEITASMVESKVNKTLGIDFGSTFNPYLLATASGANCVSLSVNNVKGNGDLGFVHNGVVTLNIVNAK